VRFEGKRVLITGAASGVGKATAALFAAEGADLLLLDIAEGPGITVIDLTDFDRVRTLVADSGPFDIVLNVAGIVRLDHIAELSFETWQRHLDVNLTAPFVISQAALAGLIERRGNIVNVASVAGLRGQAYSTAYCASKAGLVMLTKSMALELATSRVRVNCVCPGGIDTPLLAGVANTMPTDLDESLMARVYNPLPPGFAKPGEIAEAIAYLASDAARSITGSALSIDGGTLC
jgi:NAD(P)-dependent dehydrogenase (short-subunit alcohol dehydrogenase family)